MARQGRRPRIRLARGCTQAACRRHPGSTGRTHAAGWRGPGRVCSIHPLPRSSTTGSSWVPHATLHGTGTSSCWPCGVPPGTPRLPANSTVPWLPAPTSTWLWAQLPGRSILRCRRHWQHSSVPRHTATVNCTRWPTTTCRMRSRLPPAAGPGARRPRTRCLCRSRAAMLNTGVPVAWRCESPGIPRTCHTSIQHPIAPGPGRVAVPV